jgi:hypothetical protein
MPIGERQALHILVVDSALVGYWESAQLTFKIAQDGWYYLLDEDVAYSISANGAVLTLQTPSGSVNYQRMAGSGQDLAGIWERTEQSGSNSTTEEIHINRRGTYTVQWFLNGDPDFQVTGNYIRTQSHITFEELRARIETAPPNKLTFHPVLAPSETGTYTVDVSGDRWTYLGPAGEAIYTRAR